MRQFARRFAVGVFGVAALVLSVVGVAPQPVGAADAFTQVGCQINDYNCLFARNGVNPTAPQFDVSRLRSGDFGYFGYGGNPYFYGIGYAPQQFSYGQQFYGYDPRFFGPGFDPRFGGFDPRFFGFYDFSFNPPITRSTNAGDGFCNIGYGEKGCVGGR